MADTRGKILVNALSSFSKPQFLFLVWSLICGFFLLLIASYYRKQTRRNFREDGDGPGPKIKVDARRLSETTENRSVTVKKGAVGVKNSYPKQPPQ
jgi:hypothetical protein